MLERATLMLFQLGGYLLGHWQVKDRQATQQGLAALAGKLEQRIDCQGLPETPHLSIRRQVTLLEPSLHLLQRAFRTLNRNRAREHELATNQILQPGIAARDPRHSAEQLLTLAERLAAQPSIRRRLPLPPLKLALRC